jgi:cellulose biosynthesis protein BcsS
VEAAGARATRGGVTRGTVVAVLGCCLLPGTSRGQELIAGWEGDASRGYAFASPVFSVGVGGHQAIVLRTTGSYLYYSFPDSGGTTDVMSPGASATLGYRLRAGGLSTTLGAGYEVRRTLRRPSVGPSFRVNERGFTVQGELFFQATPLTNLNAIGSYGAANRYVWARAGVKRQVTNTHFQGPMAVAVGVEGTAQGNRDAHAYQAGTLIALEFLRAHGSLQLRAGYTRLQYADHAVESKPYFGVGLYRAF